MEQPSPDSPACASPTEAPDGNATGCPLLELPVELRLEIYAYAVLDCREITIGTAKLEGSPSNVVHRQYGSGRSPFTGIPEQHEPVLETQYEPSLLSPTQPAVIPLTSANADSPESTCEHTRTAYHTLSMLCKQVHDELKSHFSIPSRRETSLFIQYPHGLHVMHTVTPQLLRQSRSVHFAGTYISRNYIPRRAPCMGPRTAPSPEKLQGDIVPDYRNELSDLIKSTLRLEPTHPIEKLEMRIYYPGDDSYSTVWGDDESPIVVALRNVHVGEVGIEIWRGRNGTGVYFCARPSNEKKRVVSTVWRKFDQRGEPENERWVIDSKWPEWSVEYEMSEGPRGDTITSTLR